MIQQIKKSARSMVHFIRRCGMACRFIITPHWLNNPLESSYFPECEHKTKGEIFLNRFGIFYAMVRRISSISYMD